MRNCLRIGTGDNAVGKNCLFCAFFCRKCLAHVYRALEGVCAKGMSCSVYAVKKSSVRISLVLALNLCAISRVWIQPRSVHAMVHDQPVAKSNYT